MIIAEGDLWAYGENVDARVITTNGFRKANGACVMGRGCAREARDRWPAESGSGAWPGLDVKIGRLLGEYGNRCFRIAVGALWYLVTMPVKPEYGPNGEPGWKAQAEPWLIEQSAHQLVEMADRFQWESVVLPRPGCGNGGLDWQDVRLLLAPILDKRFTVITFKPRPRRLL